jgi:hypothetical protein
MRKICIVIVMNYELFSIDMPGLQLVERDLERRYPLIWFFVITPLHSPSLFLRCPQLISNPPVLTPSHGDRLPIGLPNRAKIPAPGLLHTRTVQGPALPFNIILEILMPQPLPPIKINIRIFRLILPHFLQQNFAVKLIIFPPFFILIFSLKKNLL